MRKEESLGELRVPNRPTQREGKAEEPEKGCCHDQTDDMQINIHDSLCARCLLIILRVLFFFALATREYFNIKDDITLFSTAFMYLTNFGFNITLIFYGTCMWDLLFNQLCCQLIPKYNFFSSGLETRFLYFSKLPSASRCPSPSYTGLPSTSSRRTEQVQIGGFSNRPD